MSLPSPYYSDGQITIYNADCKKILPYLDKADLCLTDPPYGIGESSKKVSSRQRNGGKSKALADQRDYGAFSWDSEAIDDCTMRDVIASGLNACIWGGNYYAMDPTPSWLVWDKVNGENDFADCELAWTNYGCAVRMKKHMWNGMLRKGKEHRYHPTQKPLEVILWAMQLCPGEPQIILDPFGGVGTTAVAAKKLGRKAIIVELEEKYCEIAVQRLRQGVLPL